MFFIGNSTHKCFRGAWVRTSVFEIRQIRTSVSRCVQVHAFITTDESIIYSLGSRHRAITSSSAELDQQGPISLTLTKRLEPFVSLIIHVDEFLKINMV